MTRSTSVVGGHPPCRSAAACCGSCNQWHNDTVCGRRFPVHHCRPGGGALAASTRACGERRCRCERVRTVLAALFCSPLAHLNAHTAASSSRCSRRAAAAAACAAAPFPCRRRSATANRRLCRCHSLAARGTSDRLEPGWIQRCVLNAGQWLARFVRSPLGECHKPAICSGTTTELDSVMVRQQPPGSCTAKSAATSSRCMHRWVLALPSCAGGERAIPLQTTWKVFDVAMFGAVANSTQPADVGVQVCSRCSFLAPAWHA